MYLHKNACKFYITAFELLKYKTLHAKQQHNNQLTVGQCISDRDLNPIQVIEELFKHLENILEHIRQEETVVGALINNLHSITFVTLEKKATGPEFTALSKLLQDLKDISNAFGRMNNPLVDLRDLVNKAIEGDGNVIANDSKGLTERYDWLVRELQSIFNRSSALAIDLKNYMVAINQEKELIKKEEEVATDFNKNMMSWF